MALKHVLTSSKHLNNLLFRANFRRIHGKVQELFLPLARHGASQISLIRKYLQCSFEDALNILESIPTIFFKTTSTAFNAKLSFLIDTLKFDRNLLIKNPEILKLSERTVEDRLLYMKDYGFPECDLNVILHLPKHVIKSPQCLMASGILKDDPINNVLTFIKEDVAESIRNQLPTNVYLTRPLTENHQVLLMLLLAARLKCSDEEARTILKKQPRLKNRGITSINQVLTILIDIVKLPRKRLLSGSHILKSFPNNMRKYLEFSAIGGTDAIERIKFEPRILICSADNIPKLNEIYNKYLITEEQMQKRIAFTVSPKFAEKCLAGVGKHQEFKVLRKHPNYLKVVMSLPRVETNMEKLKSRGLVSWSVNKLLKTPVRLDKELFFNNDICKGLEAIYLIGVALDKPIDAVGKQLKLHPKHSRVSFYNVQQVLDILLERGVSKEQVWNGLPVVLYDCNVVTNTLAELGTYPELSPFEEWRSHPHLISLLVYYLEKKYSFNFEAIYLSDAVSIEDHHDVL